MIARIGSTVSRIAGRWLPDPFIIAIGLSALTLALALTLGDFPSKPDSTSVLTHLLHHWRSERGLWTFLAFGMQMCLVLVAGHALAASAPVARLLAAIADRARSTGSAAAICAVAASLCSLVNWGLGLMVGALLARELGRSLTRRGIAHHYPLIVAAGFAGFLPWHGGLSGSGPLTMTSTQNMSKVLSPEVIARLADAGYPQGIPLTETTFSLLNVITTLGLVILAPLTVVLLTPRRNDELRSMAAAAPTVSLQRDLAAPAGPDDSARGFGPMLDRAWAVNAALAIALLSGLAAYLVGGGAVDFADRLQRIGLNEVNMLALAAALLLHRSPRSFLAAVEDGARGCAGIIIQFPIYGGIVAMLTISGLDRQIAGLFSDVSSTRTLPMFTCWCAGIINMFVPSGGGQWAVQGPIALDTALDMGVPPSKMVMAVAYGDQVTNMLQVFWALPLLAITGVRARDIVGYTTVVMVAAAAWITFTLLVF